MRHSFAACKSIFNILYIQTKETDENRWGENLKTCNHIYSTMENFDAFLNENSIDSSAPMLVRIHTGVHEAEGMRKLLAQLKNKLINAEFVGCSSPAVIFNGRRMTGVCMISLTLTERCYVRSAYLPCFENEKAVAGEILAERLCSELKLNDKNGQLVVFLPQNYFYCSRFAESISRIAPNIRIIGGIANDPQPELVETGKIEAKDITFTQNECGHTALAAAVIADPEMHCFEGYALGMERIVAASPVTSYDGNVLHSIAGKTPMLWLKELAGEHVTRENINIIRIFPLFREKDNNIAWPVAFIDDGENSDSVMIMDCLEENESVGIGYLGPNAVVDEVVQLYRRMKKRPAESIFAYSCTLRADILQNCSEWELDPLKKTTASGAFLGGEFFYDGESNHFGNCNFVVSMMALDETYISLDTQTLNVTHNLYHDNEHLIDFLAICASKANDMSQINIYKQLESRLYLDRSTELGSLVKMFYDVQTIKLNKVCMLSVRNGSELIAYAGYKAYDNLLKRVLAKMQKFLTNVPVWYYMSEQGELLIASNDEISTEDFEHQMRELYSYLALIEYNRLMPVFEFCLVLNHKHLLRNAKVVQSVLRTRSDIRFLIYSNDMGMEENCVRDVQMVQVINEAIANNRVLPFYQGIYDNAEQRITIYESLMRICDDDGKIYYPNEFLDVAKKYGLYGRLSYLMIKKVLETFEDRDETVTMNLSMHDLLDPSMTDMIYSHMMHSKDPSKYIFEVVESEDVTDYEAMAVFSEKIHSYGCKLALDDFGSGFSNLIHVIKIDLDYLKVDGGIIRKICEDEGCLKLLEVVAVWCKINGKKVIAEFVENSDIQEILCKYEVDYSQGYLFSKPGRLFEV